MRQLGIAHQKLIPFCLAFHGFRVRGRVGFRFRGKVGFRVRVSVGNLWLTKKVDKKEHFFGDLL